VRFAVVLAHGGGRRTRLQSLAWRRAFRLGERLIEGAVVRPELLLWRRGKGRFVVVNQHHESHVVFSFYVHDGRDVRISTAVLMRLSRARITPSVGTASSVPGCRRQPRGASIRAAPTAGPSCAPPSTGVRRAIPGESRRRPLVEHPSVS